ncbi:hypothetical protein CMUS01_06190 [Colletotrichum musicola]|uniref:GPI anchored serine-threonine rich protein n=1 Tax=Colletotrichum musicola TaxID=2175873 RepID=A0A8H6NJ19_9PEZI|nr:hypothetical protein CMUS01_06190 [Colletotrichum musicola]
MILLALLSLSTLTAAAHSPGQPLQARSGGPACLPHEAPCFRGCIEPDKVQCCSDPAQPDPWTCPLGWECGGGPKFGCWDRRPKTTSSTPPPPPIIITVTPTATPPATRAGLISTDLGPVPSDATRKRSGGADEEKLTAPVQAGGSTRLTGRETCAIDALAATAEQDGAPGGTLDGPCPRSLVATVAVGVSEAVRGGCWGSAFVIGVAAVVVLHGAF